MVLVSMMVLTIFFLSTVMAAPPDRDDVHETIRVWLMYRIQKDLQLSSDETMKLVEKIEAVETTRRDFHRLEREILTRAEQLLQSNQETAPELGELMKKLANTKENSLEQQLKIDKEIRQNLSPAQQAHLMIIMKKLERKIRNIIDMLEQRDRERNRTQRQLRDAPKGNPRHDPSQSPPSPKEELEGI